MHGFRVRLVTHGLRAAAGPERTPPGGAVPTCALPAVFGAARNEKMPARRFRAAAVPSGNLCLAPLAQPGNGLDQIVLGHFLGGEGAHDPARIHGHDPV